MRATATEWSDGGGYRLAVEKGSGEVSDIDNSSDLFASSTFRIWLANERRYRIEHDKSLAAGHRSATLVVNGQDWWWHRSGDNVLADHDGTPPHYANPLALRLSGITRLAWLDYEVIGTTEQAGRPCIRVVGHRRRPEGWRCPGVAALVGDERELLVDQETGVALRVENRVDGEAFSVFELKEVAFDEILPDSLFAWTPPTGVPLTTHKEFLEATFLPLPEAARRAGFTVLVPDLGDVCPSVMYSAAGARRPEQLRLMYQLPAGVTVSMSQQREDIALSPADGWDPVEIEGSEFRMHRSSSGRSIIQLVGRRHGTAVRLAARMTGDEVLAIAASLTPFVTTADGLGPA